MSVGMGVVMGIRMEMGIGIGTGIVLSVNVGVEWIQGWEWEGLEGCPVGVGVEGTWWWLGCRDRKFMLVSWQNLECWDGEDG